MGELLLELLSEEIPARMQRRAIDDLVALVRDRLAAAGLPAQEIRGYVTPRRLTVIADGIPARHPDRHEERRGPRAGASEVANSAFAAASGVARNDLELRPTPRGEFYFAVVERPGRPAAEVLPELLRAAIADLSWPKSMRFPDSTLHWVRPLTSVLCLFDGTVLPLPLDAVPVGRTTRGHRFLASGEIAVQNAADYLKQLEAAHVILDHRRRRELIAAELDRLAAAAGVSIKPDPALLDEVTGLVEYPVVLLGRIDDASMSLPPEVLATAMRTHQKYFSCLKADGAAAPYFLFVANNKTADRGATIIAGNERVLKARLADARFFWDQDRKVRLEDRVEALKSRVYYDKLGTMYDKVERIERLAGFLAEQLYPVAPAEAGVRDDRSDRASLDSRFRGNDGGKLPQLAQRAARLAKADLSTGMVGEFPELQGIMGRYYALNDRADPAVADAVADHYKPLGPNDTCPTAPLSIVIALADKIDALVGFYGIDETPTGSRDPFALRRAALGVSRVVLENRLRLPLRSTLEFTYDQFHSLPLRRGLVAINVLTFIVDRLKIHLREQGVRADLIAATMYREESDHDDDLVRILLRQAALAKFLDAQDGENLLVAYRRASNIVRIEAGKGGWTQGDVDHRLLRQPEETALAGRLAEVGPRARQALAREDFANAMATLATLRRPVDEFLDKITVNTGEAVVVDGVEKSLRENRLRLLSRIRAVMKQVADFSQIEG